MKIIVWGLGYVGTVSAACLAQLGHEVIGVEPHKAKVDAINSGRSPIREPNLDKLVSEGVASGRLTATQDGGSAVPSADVASALRGGAGDLLESVRLFDVYTDDQRLGQGLKSLAFALRFRAGDRTLTVEEATAARDQAVASAAARTGAVLRT